MNTLTMKNVSHKKKWIEVTVQVHMDTPLITLIKSNNNDKPDKCSVIIKLRRDKTSEKSNLYKFNLSLFDNYEPEEFLFFTRNFNMTLEASGKILSGAKIKYLLNLVRVEALCQYDTLSAETGIATPENLTSNILGLGTYFLPVNALSKQNRAMRHGMIKPRGLKVRRYSVCLIDLNEYLDAFPV